MQVIIRVKLSVVFVMLCCNVFSNHVVAGEITKKVERSVLLKESISHLENQELTVVTVELAPNVQVPAHQHEGFLYVYVLEGTVQSQLGDGDVITYQQGQNWIEPPSVIHSLTRNPSAEYAAKILVVFIAEHNAKLTTSGKLSY